jgi:pimeloyl-ACP methyl ester carboxylesterase
LSADGLIRGVKLAGNFVKKGLIASVSILLFVVLLGIIYFSIYSTKKAEYPISKNFITINSHKINYIDRGVGIPLVFIHGYGASIYSWRKNLPILSKYYRVCALDLLGFGFSDKPLNEDYSVNAYMKLIIQFMNALKIKKAVLIGHSLGGGIAVLTALKYPKRVKGLILIDAEAYAISPPLMLRVAQLPVITSIIHHIIGKWAIDISLKRSFYDQTFVTDELIENYYRPFRTNNGKIAPVKVLQAIDFEKMGAISKDYGKINKRTLIIWGKNDKISNVRLAYRLRKDIRKSVLKIIPESGHLVQEEKPEEVNKAIINFVKKRIMRSFHMEAKKNRKI